MDIARPKEAVLAACDAHLTRVSDDVVSELRSLGLGSVWVIYQEPHPDRLDSLLLYTSDIGWSARAPINWMRDLCRTVRGIAFLHLKNGTFISPGVVNLAGMNKYHLIVETRMFQ